MLAQLGQDLYAPPTHARLGGRATLDQRGHHARSRANLADACWPPSGPLGGKLDPQALAQRHGARRCPEQAQFLLRLFLQDDIARGTPRALLDCLDARAGQEGQ